MSRVITFREAGVYQHGPSLAMQPGATTRPHDPVARVLAHRYQKGWPMRCPDCRGDLTVDREAMKGTPDGQETTVRVAACSTCEFIAEF